MSMTTPALYRALFNLKLKGRKTECRRYCLSHQPCYQSNLVALEFTSDAFGFSMDHDSGGPSLARSSHAIMSSGPTIIETTVRIGRR
jgi:hypothetical protein